MNVISDKTHIDYAVCSKYLSVLVSLGIAGKRAPVYGSTKNKTLYYVKDNFFNFWYSFVPDNMSRIIAGRMDDVYRNEVEPKIPQYMGFVFEDICKQYLTYYARDLPFSIKDIGSWWGGDPRTKKEEEIDIIAYRGEDAIFGECKWRSDPVDLPVLKELKRKAELFPDLKKKYYYLFSRSGFTSAVVKEAAEDGSVRLITLDEIYGQ